MMSDNAPFSAHNTDLTELNASGSDKNLAEHGDEPGYWYSLNDGIYLLMNIREKCLNYRMNDGENFPLKDLQEYSPTRENANKILLTDPFSIEQFNNISFIDDIKTIAGKHDRDEDGNDITARNNRWSNIPQLIIIPIIIKNHWISFRIRIDDNNDADILYSDPFGNTDLIKNLKKNRQTLNKITEALNLLCGKNIKLTESSKSFNQQGNDGSNCGPITFANIHDYMKIEIPNSDLQSDEKYSIREFCKAGSSSIKNRRENDIKIYTETIKKYGKLETKNDMQPSIKKSSSSISEYEKEDNTQSVISAKVYSLEKVQKILDDLNAQNSFPTSTMAKQDLRDILNHFITLTKSSPTKSKKSQQPTKAFSDSVETIKRLIITESDFNPTKGLKDTLHGSMYQIELITLVAIRTNRRGDNFVIASEVKGFDKFDDLIVISESDAIYIQVKHSSTKKDYEEDNFFSDKPKNTRSNPYMWLYFDHWLKIKNSEYYLEKLRDKSHQFIFFSNCGANIRDILIDKDNAKLSLNHLFEDLEGHSFKFNKLSKKYKPVKCIFTYIQTVANKLLKDLNNIKKKKEFEKSLEHAYCTFLKVKNILMEANKDIDEQNSRPYILISDMAIIASELSNEPLRSKLREEMTDDEKSYYDKNSTTIKTIMNNIMLEQIHQFFDEFIVKISQSDTAQLRNLIYEEIRSETDIANLEVHSMVRGKMIDWLADKSLCVLMPNKFNEFVTAPENNARRFFLLKYTQSFISEYDELVQGHKINTSKIEIEIEALKEFLINTNRNDLVMLLYGVGVKLRIYWTLKSMDNYSKLDEWSFLEISFKSMMQGMLPKILQGVTLKFVIIDCRLQNKSPSEVLVLLEKVLHAAFTNNKKIILIIKADDQKEYRDKISDIDRNLKADSDSKPLNIVNEELKELSSNKLKLLYENHSEKYMYLAGKNYLLFKILQDESSNLYEFIADVDNITAVMKELNEQKFEHPLASCLPYKVYLKNQIIKMIPIYALRNVLETKDLSLLIFECKVDFERLKKLLNGWFNFEERKQFTSKIREARQNSDIIYILSRQTCDIDSTLLYTPKKKRVMIYVGDFNSLTGEHKDLNHIVVKLKNPNKLNKHHKWSINKEDNTDTIKLDVIGRIPVFITDYSKELQLPPASEYINQCEEEYSLPTILPKNNNFVILSADAGFGKTALLINRINEWAGDENLESILSWKLYVHLPSQRFDDFQDLQTFVKKLVRDFTLKDWQLKALLNDMEKEDRVELLFDGLDEIKDENKIITFNKLLTEISDTTAIVITTRPYAAYKVDKPIKRNLGLYLTLARYTDEQRDKYIKMMIPKILNEGAMHSFMRDTRMTEKKIAKIANNLCEHIDQEISKKVQHLIGIPLECYIFCETKASKIIIYGTDCIDNGDEAQEEKSLKSTSGLYREFLFTKLKVFTERYLNISLNNDLKDRSRIYNVSSNYIIILAVLAFKQAFQLSSNFVHSALARSYFTKEMLNKLKHTGLVTVSKHADEDFAGGGRCLSLNFNHATYQEYLAALYLLYGLILDDELRSIVQCQIKNNRYDPSYALILSLAAQLSIDEIEVIPGFAADKHAILFWKALCDEADILGAAESKLLQKCLYEFSDKMVTTLIKIVNSTSCYKKIKKELGKRSKKYLRELEEFIITDQSNIPQPMIFDDSKSETESLSTVEDSDIKKLKNKNVVIEFTNDLQQSKGSDYVARAFEIIIKEKIKSDHDKVKSEDYWGMDGGFEAMALLGDSFNNCHAQYFIKRVDNYPEHRWSKACNAIESLLKYCTKPNVKAECVNLIECLAKHALEYDSPERLIPLIKAVRSEIFLSFSQLEDQIRELPEYSIPNEIHGRPYQQFILKFTFALWISIKMTYAVIKSKDTHEIIIKEEKVKKIKIDRDKVHVWNLIENVIDELANQPNEDRKARLLINTKRWKCLIYEGLVEMAIKNKDYSALHDETFIDIVVKDYHIVANILKIYHEHKLIDGEVAARLSTFIVIINDIKSIQWPIKGGIEAIAYVGKHFSPAFANFLARRAKSYPNNKRKAAASLRNLKQILQNCNDDETYRDAVNAYNWCRQQNIFKDHNLEPIQSESLN